MFTKGQKQLWNLGGIYQFWQGAGCTSPNKASATFTKVKICSQAVRPSTPLLIPVRGHHKTKEGQVLLS